MELPYMIAPIIVCNVFKTVQIEKIDLLNGKKMEDCISIGGSV